MALPESACAFSARRGFDPPTSIPFSLSKARHERALVFLETSKNLLYLRLK